MILGKHFDFFVTTHVGTLLSYCSFHSHIEEEATLESARLKIGFNAEKSVHCILERPDVALHGSGGTGICIADTAFKSGTYQWNVSALCIILNKLFTSLYLQVFLLRETQGNESTCIGISNGLPQDQSYRSSQDMWLYRAYSGHLYHGGEIKGTLLSEFTEGDVITVLLDLEDRTLSFAKNDGPFQTAFSSLPEDVSS